MQLKARDLSATPALSVLAMSAALLSLPFSAVAQNSPVSVGAGVRTSFTNLDIDGASEDINDFEVTSARIYIGGQATEDIDLMFNTEYSTLDEKVVVIDAVAKFEFSKEFNIWAGRFLPPSDRANLYGPFYANNFVPFVDGVQANFPSETTGRQDGVMYWGQFGIAKISAGVFDASGTTKGDSDVIYAARAQLDFWDAEDGYYLNGTYYGEKDLLAVGVASQAAGSDNAYTVDFLLEKKLSNLGVVSVEAEYAKYDGLGGAPLVTTFGGLPLLPAESDGFYALGAYLFPQVVGIGRIQLLLKAGETTFEFPIIGDVDLETTEFNVNYIIKDFKARIGVFYVDSNFKPSSGGLVGIPADSKQLGILFQVQI